MPKSSPARTRELEAAIDSEDMARRLDGLPPLKRNRQDYVELTASPIPAVEASEIPVPMDDSSFELVLLAEFDDEIYLAKTKSSEIAWARLTEPEREQFQWRNSRPSRFLPTTMRGGQSTRASASLRTVHP